MFRCCRVDLYRGVTEVTLPIPALPLITATAFALPLTLLFIEIARHVLSRMVVCSYFLARSRRARIFLAGVHFCLLLVVLNHHSSLLLTFCGVAGR